MKLLPQAVCMFLVNHRQQVLAISGVYPGGGKADRTKWGLPGGKVEAHESLLDAVRRETYEESGYVVSSPQSIFCALVPPTRPGGQAFLCTTFTGTIVAEAVGAPRSFPFEGDVEWVRAAQLCSGPYGRYNAALLLAVQMIQDNGHGPGGAH